MPKSYRNLLSSFNIVAYREDIEIGRCTVVAENEHAAKMDGWHKMSSGQDRAFGLFDESVEIRIEDANAPRP